MLFCLTRIPQISRRAQACAVLAIRTESCAKYSKIRGIRGIRVKIVYILLEKLYSVIVTFVTLSNQKRFLLKWNGA